MTSNPNKSSYVAAFGLVGYFATINITPIATEHVNAFIMTLVRNAIPPSFLNCFRLGVLAVIYVRIFSFLSYTKSKQKTIKATPKAKVTLTLSFSPIIALMITKMITRLSNVTI